jgi:hypothetical protein
LEFLDTLEKVARKMPRPYEFDPGHADGPDLTDWMEGEKVLNEITYQCQQSLEGIADTRIEQEARSWAMERGVEGVSPQGVAGVPALAGRLVAAAGLD